MLSRIGHWGLDFAMVAAFIGMIIPYLKNRPTYFAVLVSGTAAVLLNGLPHKLGLILATVAGIAAGVTADRLAWRKPDTVKAEEI
jgi:predicted branched-subunit amino acid permease